MSDPVLYLVMRNDLPSLNPGKLAAQAAHAANCAVKFGPRATVRAWERQTRQGFGTTIVLGADLWFIQAQMPPRAVVTDPTYPCAIPYEVGLYLSGTVLTTNVILNHDHQGAVFLRREVVGAWHIGDRLPAFDDLELYP